MTPEFIGGVIIVIITGLLARKKVMNNHRYTRSALQELYSRMDRIEDKIDKHLQWHLEKQ